MKKNMKTNLIENYLKIINETSDDTWNDSVKECLSGVLKSFNDLQYEIDNTAKGSFSNCKTTQELAEYLKQLSEEVKLASDKIINL